MSPILSVCIPTFSNPEGVKRTLEDLISEAASSGFIDRIEFCIADNSENEDTEKLITALQLASTAQINYYRHGENIGYDRNVDAVLKLAHGKYCWLLSDNENVAQGNFAQIFSEVETCDVALVIICPGTVKAERLKTYQNLESAIVENDWWIPGGLVSRNIIKRSLIPKNLSPYFGNYWLHLSITTQIGGDNPVMFIGEKFIDDPNGVVKWAKNGTTFLTYLYLINIIKELSQPPYTHSFVKTLVRKMQLGIPRNTLSAKLYGLSITRDNLKLIYKATHGNPLIMVLSVGAILIPTVLIKYAKRIKHYLGN